MRCTAVVLREVFKGQAEVFQFLFHLMECPLDFLRCVHNLYVAGERVIAQRKRLLDLHRVVSVGKEDRAASSEAISLSVKPTYCISQYVGMDYYSSAWGLWSRGCCDTSSLLLVNVVWCSTSSPWLNYLQPKRSAVSAFQHGWLSPVCAPTALH